jgi:GPH family glycoside/pentoside/hexuronide:cation symporter
MLEVWAYSVGHLSNDLIAATVSVYMSWYLINVVELDAYLTGLVFLVGQISDGIATVFISLLSDKYSTPWGKRMPWYFVGSMMTFPCFFLSLSHPEFINKKDENGEPLNYEGKAVFYIFLSAIINIGWAFVQISHMSMVNSLTFSNRKRDELTNNRSSFTYTAYVISLLCSLVCFMTISNVVYQFKCLSLLMVIVGILSSLFFIFQIKEPKLTEEAREGEIQYQAMNIKRTTALNPFNN